MGKTIIISNRLPVRITEEDGELVYKSSEGGLATGLGSIYRKGGNIWIGWPGKNVEDPKVQKSITKDLQKEHMYPVYLSQQLIEDFYEGFSNETIWPTYHYFNQYTVYKESLWEAYVEANEIFCKAVLEVAKPEDTIWVHDYQLLLLPQMIRDRLKDISIGFFQHIPFPSYEVFRMLPWRKEILKGMLGSDLIGFHTYDDMRHFLSSVSRVVGLSYSHGRVETGHRVVEVDAFPMGIDYEKYAESAAAPKTIEQEIIYRTSLGDQKLILSIDRLDYSKGIPQRLMAFERFLMRYPEYEGKVSLIMIVVPSRDNVGKYKKLKQEVDLLVGRINGRYGRINWTPVHYFYRSFPLESLSAFYRMAHVALVTPMRDGMNLVCKEYLASKLDKKGALVLSEMAGASKELSESLLINPNDLNSIVRALYRALTMDEEEQVRRISSMQEILQKYNIHHWVTLFMDRLSLIIEKQKEMLTKTLDKSTISVIKDNYKRASSRMLFLDYDGTLTGFKPDPQAVKPDNDLLFLLRSLVKDDRTRVVIISGRDRQTLEKWLGHMKIDIIAEHGMWLRERGSEWETIDTVTTNWKEEIRKALELYVNRTPGSFIEEKDFSLVWHYRKVETGLGELRTRELSSHLKYLSTNKNLQVLEGDMVVEVKSAQVNKGKAALKWLKKFPHEFAMALGDDWTDEDTFKVMPDGAYTIKVGSTSSAAKYNIPSFREVRTFLKDLSN